MNKTLKNLLIIEDCNIIANAYKNILIEIPKIKFNINFAKDCDEAIKQIQNTKIDLVLLDLHLPISKNERYLCGEDLGLLIRRVSSKTKIIILTSITDLTRILNIISELNPEGFIIKSDINQKQLKEAVNTVLSEKNYYSKTVKGYTNKYRPNDIHIDDFDRQILYHLSMGEKTKNLSKYVPLSTRAIEVRKTKLKTLLDTKNDVNFNLVKVAKKLGLI